MKTKLAIAMILFSATAAAQYKGHRPETVKFGNQDVTMKATVEVQRHCNEDGGILDQLGTTKNQTDLENLWLRSLNECGYPDALVALSQFAPNDVEAYAYLFVYAEHMKYNARVTKHAMTQDMVGYAMKLLTEAGKRITPAQQKQAVERAAQIRREAVECCWLVVDEPASKT